MLRDAQRSQTVAEHTAARVHVAILRQEPAFWRGRWVALHGSAEGSQAVVALHLRLVERSDDQSFHRVAGSAGHVSRDLVGHHALCCEFLGAIVQGGAGPRTCLVHMGKRCGRRTSCGGGIFCFEVIMLSWSQAKGAR